MLNCLSLLRLLPAEGIFQHDPVPVCHNSQHGEMESLLLLHPQHRPKMEMTTGLNCPEESAEWVSILLWYSGHGFTHIC